MIFLKNKIFYIFKSNIGEFIYLGAQYSTPVISFLVNIFIMRYVAPEILGKYQSIMLLGSYLTFLQLGVFNGLNRNLAYYKGSNQLEKLKQATSSGFWFSIFISFIAVIIVMFISTSNLNDKSNVATLAFSLLFITVFTQPITVFLDTLYRTGQDFKKLGKFIIIDNALFAVGGFLIVFFGYLGYIIQNVLKVVLELILRLSFKIGSIQFYFSFKVLKEQFSTGFLLMVNGYLYTTFFIFDQFYIVRNFETIELGYYNLARLVLMIIPIIPNSLTTVLYPKASAAYGKSGNDNSILKSFFKKALIVNSIVVLPVILAVYFSIPYLVEYFLPQYSNGIEYAQISVWGGLGFILVGPSVIMGVLKRNNLNFVLLGVLSMSSYGFYFMNIISFDKIETLILYKNILFIGYAIMMLCYIYFVLLKEPKGKTI